MPNMKNPCKTGLFEDSNCFSLKWLLIGTVQLRAVFELLVDYINDI